MLSYTRVYTLKYPSRDIDQHTTEYILSTIADREIPSGGIFY